MKLPMSYTIEKARLIPRKGNGHPVFRKARGNLKNIFCGVNGNNSVELLYFLKIMGEVLKLSEPSICS